MWHSNKCHIISSCKNQSNRSRIMNTSDLTNAQIIRTMSDIKMLVLTHKNDSNNLQEIYNIADNIIYQLKDENRVHALFVANYIIEYASKKNYNINNFLLQHILYFIYIRCLLEHNKNIYKQQLTPNKYGFRDEKTYNEYHYYGAFDLKPKNIINSIIKIVKTTPKMDVELEYYNPLNVPYKELIENTVDSLHMHDPFELSDIIKNQDPWKYQLYKEQSIIDYYQTHQEAQIWNKQK